jgi:UDP-N-acetylglucosamine 2-epimerase
VWRSTCPLAAAQDWLPISPDDSAHAGREKKTASSSRPVHIILRAYLQIRLVPPLSYHPFVVLRAQITLILGDSGGVHEKAPSLGKPVLVLRRMTERLEVVDAGTVQVVGTDRRRIVAAARRLLDDSQAYHRMAGGFIPMAMAKPWCGSHDTSCI